MDESRIKRINELFHKSKAEGLTEAEKEEQKQLRKEYIQAVRGNITSQLNNISVVNPDGSVTDLGKEHAQKKKMH